MGFEEIRRRLATATFTSLLVFCAPAVIIAQQPTETSPLSLQQAVSIALEKNPARKAALADRNLASADIREARSVLFPHVTFSEIATRGNDPVYVFGTKLRQQRFALGDFDLSILNTPTPLGNFATRFGGTWNLFDSFASWRAINRAERVKDAAGHQLERTDQEIIFRVVESFYAVLLAKRQMEVAGESVKTAQAILDRSKNRFENGVVVEADLLSAQVRLASRKQEVIRATNNLALAHAELNSALGVPDTDFDPTEDLAERNYPATTLEEAEKKATELRPDLKRLRSDEAAQRQSVSIAKSAFGPRVNALAGWEADNPTFLGGRGGNDWLAGIEVQFDLFQGGARRARLSHEHATQEQLAAVKEMATNEIRLEVRRAYYDLASARQQVEVARASIAQSRESLRMNQDRYDSGLSTITDALAAEDAARRSETDYWEAVYRYHTGYANLELATGMLNAQSPVVLP